MKLKENWQRWTPEQAQTFLRWGPEGKRHPSRVRVLGLIEGLSSVLDVGCGNGVMFEMIRERKLDLDYLGIDVTERLLAVARQLFPADAHRFRRLSLYELKKLRGQAMLVSRERLVAPGARFLRQAPLDELVGSRLVDPELLADLGEREPRHAELDRALDPLSGGELGAGGLLLKRDVRRDASGFAQIYVARSIDEGSTWTATRATDGTHNSAYPEIAVTKRGIVGVLYVDYNDSGPATIFRHRFTRSFNRGQTWSDRILQSMDPNPTGQRGEWFPVGGLRRPHRGQQHILRHLHRRIVRSHGPAARSDLLQTEELPLVVAQLLLRLRIGVQSSSTVLRRLRSAPVVRMDVCKAPGWDRMRPRRERGANTV
jgi:Methyltransferase domain